MLMNLIASSKMRICLTGGPSAGKTTVVDILQREFSNQAKALPEVASLLYRGGFPRLATKLGIQAAQRAIYYTQIELETVAAADAHPTTIISDRGTLDALAYWPDTQESFLSEVQTTIEREVNRYDLVIHLHTSPHDYNKTAGVRTESLQQALELDQKIHRVWGAHPRRISIPAQLSFHEKINTVLQILEAESALHLSTRSFPYQKSLSYGSARAEVAL